MLLLVGMSAASEFTPVWMVAAPGVRRTLTPPGDIRADIDFQNDINRLLARIEESKMPWRFAAELCTYAVGAPSPGDQSRNSVKPLLRVLDGGRRSLPARQQPDADGDTEGDGDAGYAATAPATAVPSFSRR
jgi:hypothetical protein